MLQTFTQSQHHFHLPIKPNPYVNRVLKNFLETGRFVLANHVITTDILNYMMEYLVIQPESTTRLNYELYLDNLILDIEIPETYSQNNPREYADDKLLYLLEVILNFSPKWRVISLDNLSILQEENYYPLSFNFIWHFGNLISEITYDPIRRGKKKKLIVTHSLIITNAEFHSWVWRELLRKRTKLNKLTLEFLANGEQEENLAFLCEVLQYSDIEILNLGNTEFNSHGYQILNRFLKKEPFINVQLREPVDFKSRTILRVHNDRIKYTEQDKNFDGDQSLATLPINQLKDGGPRTLGHWLLEHALEKDDIYMVKYLIKAGVNLLEQRGEEPPFLLQLFEKNQDFKLMILNYIIHHKVLAKKIECELQNYSDLKHLIAEMEASIRAYAKILRQRTHGLISDYRKLLNLFKTMASLSRPSKKRDQEFINIYWRLFKSVILFHDSEGKVTLESISNTQVMLNKIINISENAELGWSQRSRLHKDLITKLNLIIKDMNDIKELMVQTNLEQAKLVESTKTTIDSEELNESGSRTGFYFKF